MSASRRFLVLLIATVVIAAFAFWTASRRDAPAQPSAGTKLVPELNGVLNSVTEVHIRKGGGPETTLKKNDTGWVVVEKDFAADPSRVRKLLLDLASLQIVEEKTREPASYPAIGVEDLEAPKSDSMRADVMAAGKTYSIILGETSGIKSTFVRVAGDPQSYLATPQIALDPDPKQWIDRNLVAIPEARIKEVAVAPSSGPSYTISREKAEQANFTVARIPAKRKLKSDDTANSIATSVALLAGNDVRKTEPQDDTAGKPATATFHTFDGLTLKLTGHKEGELHLVAIHAESSTKETADEAAKLNARLGGREFELPNFKYDGIFRPLEDLLAPK